MVETDEGRKRAVCFTADQYKQIQDFEKSKSPVKLENFDKNTFRGNEDIIIRRNTKITPVNVNEVNFEYPDICDGTLATISQLDKIAVEQLVTFKAEGGIYGSIKSYINAI